MSTCYTLLVDVFSMLPLNEVDKCQLVAFDWDKTVLMEKGKKLNQRRVFARLKVLREFIGRDTDGVCYNYTLEPGPWPPEVFLF